MEEDEFDGEGGDFGDEDPAKGVGDGCVETDEGEGGVVGIVVVEFYAKVLRRMVGQGSGRGRDVELQL